MGGKEGAEGAGGWGVKAETGRVALRSQLGPALPEMRLLSLPPALWVAID